MSVCINNWGLISQRNNFDDVKKIRELMDVLIATCNEKLDNRVRIPVVFPSLTRNYSWGRYESIEILKAMG